MRMPKRNLTGSHVVIWFDTPGEYTCSVFPCSAVEYAPKEGTITLDVFKHGIGRIKVRLVTVLTLRYYDQTGALLSMWDVHRGYRTYS